MPLKPPTPAPASASNGLIRYGSPSAPELSFEPDLEAKMKRTRQESIPYKIERNRAIILIVTVPLILLSFVLFLISRTPATIAIVRTKERSAAYERSKSYAVIFDAGSSGSRVHVFCFDENLNLMHIGDELELFEQKKPGLSVYAKDPQQAAVSLVPLLEKAEGVVPKELRHRTPVRVGATAGLRTLGSETSEQILQAVRELLQHKSSLKFQPNWVTILNGTQEGTFQWVTINYLLRRLGKSYASTVGVVDLGGGSVQIAYAISQEDAEKAPKVSDGEDSYVQKLFLKGTQYYLYVHSYLHYGLLAARAEILKVSGDGSNCILGGYHGLYKYSDETYKASASPSSASFSKCRHDAVKAVRKDEVACTHMKCTFGGIWNGGDGDGQKNLFVASFFFDRAAEVGFVDRDKPVSNIKPADFEEAATRACQLNFEDAKAAFPLVQADNLPYLCMDLTYQYTLLVDGFGIDPHRVITLVKQVPYGDASVEAAWPLGSAIEASS